MSIPVMMIMRTCQIIMILLLFACITVMGNMNFMNRLILQISQHEKILPKHKAILALMFNVPEQNTISQALKAVSKDCYDTKKDANCLSDLILYLGRSEEAKSDNCIELKEGFREMKQHLDQTKTLEIIKNVIKNHSEEDPLLASNKCYSVLKSSFDIFNLASSPSVNASEINFGILPSESIVQFLIRVLSDDKGKKGEKEASPSISLDILKNFINNFPQDKRVSVAKGDYSSDSAHKERKELLELIMKNKDNEKKKHHVREICGEKIQSLRIGICSHIPNYYLKKVKLLEGEESDTPIGPEDKRKEFDEYLSYLKSISFIPVELGSIESNGGEEFAEEIIKFYMEDDDGDLIFLSMLLRSSRSQDITWLWNKIKFKDDETDPNTKKAIETFWKYSDEEQFVRMFIEVFNSQSKELREWVNKAAGYITNSLRFSNDKFPHDLTLDCTKLTCTSDTSRIEFNQGIDGKILTRIFNTKSDNITLEEWNDRVTRLLGLGFKASVENFKRYKELFCRICTKYRGTWAVK